MLAKFYAVPQYQRREGAWSMSSDALEQIKALPEAEADGPLYGQPALLFGKPIRIKEDADGIRFGADPDRPKRLLGRGFLEALGDAGILRAGDYVRRIVIDASVDGALIMYVERFGDQRLLNVTATLDGVEIQGVPAPEWPEGSL